MINCLVINLKSQTEKKYRIEQRLKHLNINYEIFDAVNGIEEKYMNSIELDEDWRDPYTGRVMTQGEVGCALSHYNVWKKALDMPNDITLILEDDADFVSDFDEKLEKILTELEQVEWDVCYLGRKKMSEDGENISENLSISGYSYWLVGYLVNKNGLNKLVNSGFDKKLIPVDEFVPILGNVSPYLNKYSEYYSDNITLLTIKNNIINPESGAFTRSTTELSPTIDIVDDRLIILSTYTEMNNGIKRFVESCDVYGLKYKLVETDNNLETVKDELNNLEDDQIVMISDNTNVIMTTNTEEIINKYYSFDTPIVCSVEKNGLPNFNGYIGKVRDIKLILPYNNDYEKILINHGELIALDNKCEIFQYLSTDNKDTDINYGKSRLYNKKFRTHPCHINGNESKVYLNRLESYLMKNWTNVYGYNTRNMIPFDNTKSLYIFISANSIFLNFEDFMNGIININYPKENIILTFYNLNKILIDKLNNIDELDKYNEIQVINDDKKSEADIANWSINDCLEKEMDYYFSLSQTCYLNNPDTIKNLMMQNKEFIAPFISKESAQWDANFWGDLNNYGYYERSFDYYELVERKRTGCWNVPFVKWAYLIKKESLKQLTSSYNNDTGQLDMSICKKCRDNNISIYVDNLHYYGIMKKISDKVPSTAIHPEFYMFDSDREAWLNRYCHPDFLNAIDNWEKLPVKELCTFAYEFPFFNNLFCEHLIDETDNLGEWSEGNNTKEFDKRIGTVENVPTVDIHLKQIGFHDQWNTIIKDYIAKLVCHLYSPYKTNGVHLSFVVKYTLGGQDHLTPHHDAATYSLVITLNRPGIDFQGGGTRFVKQDVTHIGTQGSCTIHPGRLTHYHEGVKITDGERYIMVTFVT